LTLTGHGNPKVERELLYIVASSVEFWEETLNVACFFLHGLKARSPAAAFVIILTSKLKSSSD